MSNDPFDPIDVRMPDGRVIRLSSVRPHIKMVERDEDDQGWIVEYRVDTWFDLEVGRYYVAEETHRHKYGFPGPDYSPGPAPSLPARFMRWMRRVFNR